MARKITDPNHVHGNTGRKMSEETKAAMSAAKKAMWAKRKEANKLYVNQDS